VRYVVPPGLARGVKLAIVMELCHLGSLFSMIGQVRALLPLPFRQYLRHASCCLSPTRNEGQRVLTTGGPLDCWA